LMQRNDFPKSIKVGKRVFWDDAEVAAWVQFRKDLRSEVA
jgi:predicted DNA-binding transcriptional regulator AlpA